jgi:hypothetical protein
MGNAINHVHFYSKTIFHQPTTNPCFLVLLYTTFLSHKSQLSHNTYVTVLTNCYIFFF